jgi:uncharacterized protein (DUF983 family)
MSRNPLWIGVGRGVRRLCPNCGQGSLFDGFLKVSASCPVCGANNADYPCDDFPPYLTIFAVGHLIVPLLALVSLRYELSVWLQIAIWLPVTTLLCLLLLPGMKGAVAGFCWAMGFSRQQQGRA